MADKFPGFLPPTENYSKLPHQMIDALPLVETVSEMKVILYILRHTWGFQDQWKRITLDEFEHGRKDRKGHRLDAGVGLSIPSIRDGLKRAEEHGFILVETDNKDKARVKKFYSLAMAGGELLQSDCKGLSPTGKNLSGNVKDSDSRSGKETLERNPQKETEKKSVSTFPENPAPTSAPDDSGGADDASIVDAIIEQTMTHPGPCDLGLITEEAQAEVGNWADPGKDSLPQFGLFCLYAKRNKAPPTQGTGQHRQQCERVGEALRAYGYQQTSMELVEKAAEIYCERKGAWVNVFYKSFVADFGVALQDAEYFLKHGCLPDDQKGGTHGSHQAVHGDRKQRTPDQWRDAIPT